MNRADNRSKLSVRLLNIQGLTMNKKFELQRLFQKDGNALEILALVETHVREDRFAWNKEWKIHEKRRKDGEKKGGGLLIVYKENSNIKLDAVEVDNSDLLVLKGTIGTHKIKLILVYYTTRSSTGSKEINQKITNNLKGTMEQTDEDESMILMGDFNGHLGMAGEQRLDENGRILKELADEYNLVIGNLDEKCEGEITWGRGEQQSAIDYILLNRNIYKNMESMYIDEKQIQFDLSDHNLLEISFRLRSYKRWNNTSKENSSYYWKMNESTLKEFTNQVERKIERQEINNIEALNQIMINTADDTMKRKYTRKVNK